MNDANDRTALFDQGDGHGPSLIAANEGRRAVDRVDDDHFPARQTLGSVGGLLGQPAGARRQRGHLLEQETVDGEVGLRDRRAAALVIDVGAGAFGRAKIGHGDVAGLARHGFEARHKRGKVGLCAQHYLRVVGEPPPRRKTPFCASSRRIRANANNLIVSLCPAFTLKRHLCL